MITHFTEAEKAVHYPADSRAFLGMKPCTELILLILFLGSFSAAWLQYLLFGLPVVPSSVFAALQQGDPSGFPVWISLSQSDKTYHVAVHKGKAITKLSK